MKDRVYEQVLIAKLKIAQGEFLAGRIDADTLRAIIEDVERKAEADRCP